MRKRGTLLQEVVRSFVKSAIIIHNSLCKKTKQLIVQHLKPFKNGSKRKAARVYRMKRIDRGRRCQFIP